MDDAQGVAPEILPHEKSGGPRELTVEPFTSAVVSGFQVDSRNYHLLVFLNVLCSMTFMDT